ncbi:hypothetical protein XELAEV_18021038mg [Xenopus laevis]|uniref:Paraneoplastic antigen Ma-like C-terminal domain-containing protein n=1 Tax=Xenopus laevis TaxID=8355 RepID=A0A974DAD1_XENLA|nr:hypothetical protein XELAEV_18021038mg [Xenopus laevis]
MFDENMSAFETPQSVHQWSTAVRLNPQKIENRYFTGHGWLHQGEILLNVLIEREIDCDQVPPDMNAESEGPWKIVLPDMSDNADELTSQGDVLINQYAVKAPESVLLNMTLFDSPAEKSKEMSILHRFCTHSEESFESWRDTTVVPDWTGPETTIRRNILESLYSPTMDVVKFYMKEKEYLSAYHVQLEQGLRLLVSHGAITDNEMDSLRIRQLKRETLNSEPVVVTIRVHYQDKLPPGYVALMERVQSSTSEHAEKYSTDAKLLEENKKLCKELEELEAQLSERAEPTAEAKKVSKCYQYGMLGHIQSICPVTDEVRQRRRRFYGRWYKCQVVGLR